jgi:hypothetical protein
MMAGMDASAMNTNPPAGHRAPGAQVRAALGAVPGSSLQKYILPEHPGEAVRVIASAGAVDRRVYVDPQSLAVLNVIGEEDRPPNIAVPSRRNTGGGAASGRQSVKKRRRVAVS